MSLLVPPAGLLPFERASLFIDDGPAARLIVGVKYLKKSSLDCVTSSEVLAVSVLSASKGLAVSVLSASKGLAVSVSVSVFSKPVRAELSFASIISVNTESSNSSIQSKVSSINLSPFSLFRFISKKKLVHF